MMKSTRSNNVAAKVELEANRRLHSSEIQSSCYFPVSTHHLGAKFTTHNSKEINTFPTQRGGESKVQ